MLYLDSATTIQGVTLYRDYSSAKLVYRRDIRDNPAFKEGNRLGGGFLTMAVALLVPEAVLTAIRSALSGQGGQEVELTPVPFDQGSVRVTPLGTPSAATAEGDLGRAGECFVERIPVSAKPGFYGDNRAVLCATFC